MAFLHVRYSKSTQRLEGLDILKKTLHLDIKMKNVSMIKSI